MRRVTGAVSHRAEHTRPHHYRTFRFGVVLFVPTVSPAPETFDGWLAVRSTNAQGEQSFEPALAALSLIVALQGSR